MTDFPRLTFSLDRDSKVPVFEQICLTIRQRAISGALAKGSTLPPTRVLATELGVSRSTIVTAYEQLVAEGYLKSLRGSGYTVCALGEVELSGGAKAAQTLPEDEEGEAIVPFEASQPDMRLFPHRQWAKAVSRVCRTNPQAMLVGGSTFGNPELRRAIAQHIAEWRGIDASPQQIIVTAGATDALEICMRSLAQKGDLVGLEDPGYLPMRRFAQAQDLVPLYLAVDDAGAHLPDPTKPPQLVILTPSHQYPLGGAMSPSRRLEFINWADAQNAWIVEDDYDSEFRYAGRPIPAMTGFDRLNRTIYIGSFSKVFSNALRLGYLVVPEALLDRFRTTMRRFGQKASYMPQQALADFMASGEFYRHLRRVRRTYDERRRFLLDQLATEFSAFGRFEDHQAGMQVVFHLAEGFDDRDLSARATALGINLQPLSAYAAHAEGHNGLVMGFCAYSEEEMKPALALLRSCFQQSG